MRYLKIFAVCFLSTFLFTSCQSDKNKKENDTALEDEDPIGDTDVPTLEQQLNSINYQLDWNGMKRNDFKKTISFTPLKTDGYHLYLHKYKQNLSDSVWEEKTDTFAYGQGNSRFVLVDGEKVAYTPDINVDDLGLIGKKECILHLAKVKINKDPRIKDKSTINEVMYHLQYGDEDVREDIKRIAKEHFKSACTRFEYNGEQLQKFDNESRMILFLEPTEAKGVIAINFYFDENGFLKVYSAHITDNYGISYFYKEHRIFSMLK